MQGRETAENGETAQSLAPPRWIKKLEGILQGVDAQVCVNKCMHRMWTSR